MRRYTVCFLRRGDDVLMLNRLKAPNMGIWNGVGGKIEPGESPRDGAYREILEETGLVPVSLEETGILRWEDEVVHVYSGIIPKEVLYPTPRLTDEGILDWKPIAWLTDPRNVGVADAAIHIRNHHQA